MNDIEKEMPKEGLFVKKNDCPKCGATGEEYVYWSIDQDGFTTSCNLCPKSTATN